ncbi:polymer-forming cytoskeletal protein [Bacillus sp. CGMCC 1.16607]|uniref:polymer-forming cytoskeletal protein n=1 Tax=Bacillus sp. CGMCC 1.16607 TaxID=3351842 RepID=UPI003632BCD3
MEKLGDLIINGVGSSNGGEFDRAIINGKGKVHGNLHCGLFECEGLGSVNGDVKSEKVKISGSGKISGNMYATTLSIEGNASISGDTYMNRMTVAGKSSVGGNVKGEELKVQGKIFIGGNCEVETFKAEGQFNVGGLLSAETIEIHTYGESKAKEIGGQTITVTQRSNFLLGILKTVISTKLEADVIEGDHIILENTKAKVVRGNHIVIGENCEIGLVEYKDTYKLEKNGSVKESIQI